MTNILARSRQRRQSSISSSRSQDSTSQHQEEHIPLYEHVQSPSVARSQLWAAAVELIGPGRTSAAPSSTFLYLCSYPPENAATAFAQAFDALCLVQLGTASREDSLVHQAAFCYGNAIRCLRVELAQAVRTKVFSDRLLATPYLLFWGSMFTRIRGTNHSSGSIAHLRGLAYMIQATSKQRSHLQYLLLDTHHYFLFTLGVFTQTAMPCAMSDEDEAGLAEIPDRFPMLSRLTIDLPALLEKGRMNDVKLGSLLQELSRFEAKVQWWLLCQRMESGAIPYVSLPAHEMPSFDSETDILSNSVIGGGYKFSSFMLALAYMRAWLSLLATNILRLRFMAADNPEASAIRESAGVVADDICKAIIYFLGTPACGTHGIVAVAGVMPTVTQWYTMMDDSLRLDWCKSVRNLTYSKGVTTWSDLIDHDTQSI